jgi:thioesterase domain-containing protein
MQDPSISAGELLYDSIHSMAEHYTAAIKRIAPEGPYYLLGYSLGGAVVYEVAHLLRQENHQIALLALIESWCVFSEQHHQPEQLIENFLSSHDSTTKDLADLSLARMQLLLKHRPTQTHQDILLFKARKLYKEYQAIDDPYNGWSNFTKGTIDCKIINSNHDTIINAENSKLIIDYLKKTVF